MNKFDHGTKIPIQTIADRFNVAISNVKRVNCKQLFIVFYEKRFILVSWLTVVGYINPNGVWVLTRYPYSITTSRQLHSFAGQNPPITWQDEPIDII